jgi:hypothetical protein
MIEKTHDTGHRQLIDVQQSNATAGAFFARKTGAPLAGLVVLLV